MMTDWGLAVFHGPLNVELSCGICCYAVGSELNHRNVLRRSCLVSENAHRNECIYLSVHYHQQLV